MANRLGFMSWKKNKPPLKRKKSIRSIFSPFIKGDKQYPSSTSVPSLVSTSQENESYQDKYGTVSVSVSTIPDRVCESDKSSRRRSIDDSISRTWSNLSLIYRASGRRPNLIRSQSSRRVSKSVANLSTVNKVEELKNENLASSTQAVSEALHEEVSKDKQMSIGRKKFNIDPKKGIEYLIDNGLLTHTSKDVSQFLFTGEGLNKSQIGNYLGEYTDFNLKVLHDFINLQDFTNLGILQALRQFLWTFHPPGEAQKIERMLEGFSRRYCHLNPTAFQDSSGCFTLAFCIVILNTLLHNENVKEKPPLKVFVEMVNLEQDLPEAMLEDIFEAIKAEPFKKDDGDDLMHTFFNPDREGWLWKQGGRYKSWKRRWFIMTGKCLYYFEYTTDKEFRGIIPLENIKVREVDDRRMTNCFEIFSDTSSIVKACKTSNGKVVEGRHHVYRISATSKGEKQQWMDAIRKSTMFNPLYKLLAEAK